MKKCIKIVPFQLSTYAIYFQAHGEYPWQSSRPIVSIDKGRRHSFSSVVIPLSYYLYVQFLGGIWEQLLKANIGPDMNLHYNLNGIYNRYPGGVVMADLMRNDGQVRYNNGSQRNLIFF